MPGMTSISPLDGFLNLLFPSQCPVCGSPSDNLRYNPICSACWEGIEKYDGPSCRTCGAPVVSGHATICGSCLKSKPPFAKVLYYGIYAGALREAVHLLKFGGVKRLATPLGDLSAGLCLEKADAVVPVPLSKKGLLRREFNQTADIGRRIASVLRTGFMPNALRKTRETLPQTGVSGRERLTNVRNAFAASGETAGLRVLLVDDVITTGATVRECSGVLLKAGAASVTVVALARSKP